MILFFFSLSVKEKLTADPDSEIATTSLRVSLMCPVSLFTCSMFGSVLPHVFFTQVSPLLNLFHFA